VQVLDRIQDALVVDHVGDEPEEQVGLVAQVAAQRAAGGPLLGLEAGITFSGSAAGKTARLCAPAER
jgi:hypothetical protein